MTDSEKWAIWTLGVVALTAIAYFTFVALRGSGPASQAVFALLTAFRALWVVFIGLVMTIGFVKGWKTTLSLPLWTVWWAVMLMLTVESVTTLVLYRRGNHA